VGEYRRILCPTDFSAVANVGVDHAVRLAARDGAEVLILHVLPPVAAYAAAEIPGSLLVSFADRWREEARGELCGVRSRVRRAGVATHALMVEGDPSEQIGRVAERLRCDLIVLATSGRTGLLRVLLGGSMAERVIRRAPCPVLAYRASQPLPTHERVGTPQKAAA
jgi:nucleotide-binding universal stress UspA family protein